MTLGTPYRSSTTLKAWVVVGEGRFTGSTPSPEIMRKKLKKIISLKSVFLLYTTVNQ